MRHWMFLVTGGAGFIGSNVVASLNEAGRSDIVVNDSLDTGEKWRNLGKRQLADVVPPGELFSWLEGRKLDAVIHLGAISDTTATDGDLVIETNFRLSLRLLEWCTAARTPFIYASSAATYGDGTDGFSDDGSPPALRRLKPLNLYGWSKHLFDLAVADRAAKGASLPPQWAGLKFFNVFGPNEYHKGEMMSLLAKRFDDARRGPRHPVVQIASRRHRRWRAEARLHPFAKLKAFLRKAAERSIPCLQRRTASLIPSFSARECANYFRHAGYAAT